MAVGLLESKARREKSTSNVTTVRDWWWRTGRGGVGLGEDGWGRVEQKGSIEWRWRDLECGEDGSGKEHVDTHMDAPFPRCLSLTEGYLWWRVWPVLEYPLEGFATGAILSANTWDFYVLRATESSRVLWCNQTELPSCSFFIRGTWESLNCRDLLNFKSGVLWANMEQVH